MGLTWANKVYEGKNDYHVTSLLMQELYTRHIGAILAQYIKAAMTLVLFSSYRCQ